MAPTVEPTIVTIVPWPHFQAFIDSQAAIGAKLYSYVPNTSTPKATFLDPGLITPNPNPTILDDQGSAYVWLNGLYRLRLTDADDVLLFEVDNYGFPSPISPGPGDLIMGSTDATLTPTPGAATIIFPDMAPAGYRVNGITYTITSDFGSSQGLSAIALGDSVVVDRWGQPGALTAGTTGGQLGFHDSTEFIAAPAAYTVLVSALGGLYDANGQIHLTCYWSTLPADVP
jgi:hypothetical protein